MSPAGVVLVVEDDQQCRRLLTELLTQEGYVVHVAADGGEALAALNVTPDVVLLDVQLADANGLDVCREIKATPGFRLTPIVIVTGLAERQYRIDAIDAGADGFLTKPFDLGELRARVRSLVRLKQFRDELESAESVILRLALVVEGRDAHTVGHCERLATYATALGKDLQLPTGDISALFRGAYLHDVGKVGIPDTLLKKPGPLTTGEMDVMKQHPVIGERLCGKLRSLANVRGIIRHHHEYLDGTGYPDRLRGAEVPLLAQIVGLVDAYDAMTSTRPYRGALTVDEAVAQLHCDAAEGRRSPELVARFIQLQHRDALIIGP